MKAFPKDNPKDKDYEDEFDYWEIEGWNNCLKEIDMEMKQREQLYIAFAQPERDKQDYKRKIKGTTDSDMIGYFKSIIEGCDYAQKIISEKINAHD